VSWANNGDSIEALMTCGWDGNVVSHLVPRWDVTSVPTVEPVKMEVNGEPVGMQQEVKVKDTGCLATAEHDRMNGDGDGGDHTEDAVETPS